MATDKKTKRRARPRKAIGEETVRWASAAQRDAASDAFLEGISLLITRRQKTEEWSAAETLGYRMAMNLWSSFFSVPAAGTAVRLGEALAVLERPDTKIERVAWCVGQIEYWARKWRAPEWQASAATRALCLKQLVDDLVVYEPAFAGWHRHTSKIAKLLDRYEADSRLKEGKQGAKAILATIVVETGGALGYVVDVDANDTGEIERVRIQIARDVDKFSVKTAQNKA